MTATAFFGAAAKPIDREYMSYTNNVSGLSHVITRQ